MKQIQSKREGEQQSRAQKDVFLVSGFLLSCFAALVVTGCSKYYYNPAPQILPQYISKIAVRPFVNHTRQFGIEDKLTIAVQQLFNQDGRWAITSEDQADGVVIGEISKYIQEPLAYDQNNIPKQYKLWVIVNVSFYDKIRNQTLWTEPNLSHDLTYFSASSNNSGALTDVEAQQHLWDQFAMDITTRTLEGFGTVTGASDKEVPKSSPEEHSGTTIGSPQPSPSFTPPSTSPPPY